MAQVFPIWISNVSELDLVFEGLHDIQTGLHRTSRYLQSKISELQYQYNELVHTDPDGLLVVSEVAQSIGDTIKDKKALIQEVERKIADVHQMFTRLSDPSVPKPLVDDFRQKERAKLLASIAERTM